MSKKVVNAIALSAIFVISSRNFTSTHLKLTNLLNISAAEAVQLRDRKTYFVQLPMLLDAEATVNRINATSVTYYFAIALPLNMGEPLQKIEIFQAEGFESIDFISNDTIAYLQSGSGDQVAIASKTEISQDQSSKKLTITFDPPIPAKSGLDSKLILGLRPARNPRSEGVYLFSVSASPQGDRPNLQFLGYGRLDFYSSRH